jgi:hypothetical protein
MATDAFRSLSALVSPKRKEKLEKMYKACGVFDFKGQDAQVRPPSRATLLDAVCSQFA